VNSKVHRTDRLMDVHINTYTAASSNSAGSSKIGRHNI